MDDYFYEQELRRVEENSNPNIRIAFAELDYEESIDEESDSGNSDAESFEESE